MKVNIVGAGPGGIICALFLVENGVEVSLFERSTAMCRKFLIAGSSGLNITHSLEIDEFYKVYDKSDFLYPIIKNFKNRDLLDWLEEFDVTTFVGTSGRVYPKEMNAAAILKKWKDRLTSFSNFTFYPEHHFIDFENNQLTFESPEGLVSYEADYSVLSLGGSSWSKTGSDGKWVEFIKRKNVAISDIYPINCGLNYKWRESLVERLPIKNIIISYENNSLRGEVLLTEYGLEGSGLYAHSVKMLRDLYVNGEVQIFFDLLPDYELKRVVELLKVDRKKMSYTNFLRKRLGLSKEKIKLLNLLTNKSDLEDKDSLASLIKQLPLKIYSSRPIDEAISTGGGISLSELNDNLSLKKYPNIYVMGEMLDWSAPTGGFLLQAVFSMGNWVAKDLLLKLSSK